MSAIEKSSEVTFFVANNGNDNWSGRYAAPNPAETDGPFATLQRARDEIREIKPSADSVSVELRGGVYEQEMPFELTAEDSGVTYRARQGEAVRLVGGKVVTNFEPVTDSAILERLAPEARGNVLQAELRTLGITDFGEVEGERLELFFDDKPMTLARWPNEGFVKLVDLVGGDSVDVRGTKGDKIGKFVYEGDRPKRWTQENEVWVHG